MTLSPGDASPRVSWFLLFALVLGSFTALLSTGLYLKTLQEKRAEQVSITLDNHNIPITADMPGPGQVSAEGGGGAE